MLTQKHVSAEKRSAGADISVLVVQLPFKKEPVRAGDSKDHSISAKSMSAIILASPGLRHRLKNRMKVCPAAQYGFDTFSMQGCASWLRMSAITSDAERFSRPETLHELCGT